MGRRLGRRVKPISRERMLRHDLTKALEIQTALSSLLDISLKDASLETLLRFFLDLLLDMSWLRTLPRGGIFITEKDRNVLELKVHRNLEAGIVETCARVPFGWCLCGRAADDQQILCARDVDQRHEVKYAGLSSHGHYIVPILLHNKTIGVVLLYLPAGQEADPRETAFLESYANLLANLIQRKRVEKNLRRYERIVMTASDHISLLDRNYQYLTVNPAYLKAHNRTVEEIQGLSVAKLIGQDRFETQIKDKLDRCLSGEVVNYHDWFDFPGIGHRFMDVSYYPVFDPDQSVSGAVVSCRDITERKMAEDELALYRGSLEKLVQGRTRELTMINRQLEFEISERRRIEADLARESGVNASLSELSKALIGDLTLEEISNRIMQTALELTDSKTGFIGYIDRTTGYLISPVISRDLWPECRMSKQGHVFKKPLGLWGWVIENRRTILTNAAQNDNRARGVPAGHLPIDRFLSSPAIFNDILVGQVAVANSIRNYDQQDLVLIERLASIYALVVNKKQFEDDLRESEERFRQLAENIRDVFWIRDLASGTMIYISRAFEDIWGRPREEVFLKNEAFLDYVVPEDRTRIHEALQRQNEQNDFFREEYRITRPDGSIRWIRARNWPVVNEQGRFYRVVGVAEDITERKQAEHAIIKAKEAAESSNRAKTEFLANISHELRTPLNPIIGMTDLMMEGELNAEQAEFLMDIRVSAVVLLNLIDDLIELSRIEAEEVELCHMPFSPRECLARIIRELSGQAGKKGLGLNCRVDDGIPLYLSGDQYLLGRILAKVGGNAVKFTEKGQVGIAVTREKVDGQDIWLHFSVSDTGIGIPDSHLQREFQDFTQVDGSMTRKHGGLGLGLTLVRRMVNLMKGRIWVESVLGQGSNFHIVLPFRMTGNQEETPV